MLNLLNSPRGTRGRRRLRRSPLLAFWLLLSLCITAALALAPTAAVAQERQFHLDRFDSVIFVNQDGSLDVEETLVYVFQGQYRRGIREWETDRLENIGDFRVSEVVNGEEVAYEETSFAPDEPATSGQPGTYGVRTGNPTRVRWIYQGGPTPSSGTTRKTFIIRYHVEGAMRVYGDRDELQWFAVPQESPAPINSSKVEVILPDGTDTSNFTTQSAPGNAEVSKQGDTITFSADSQLDNGFELGIQIPKGVLNATAPSWQSAVDAEERAAAEMERIRPIIDFAVLVLSLLIGVGGVLFVVRRWYMHGRDKPVKLFSDYVAEPPSNLPPGLVGTLLDESADVRDVISTLVDQARKGNLTIQETRTQGFLTQGKDFEYRLLNRNVEYRFEEMLLDAVFKGDTATKLSDLKNTFYTKLPPIYDEMYKSLVALKYFPENPKAVRNRNMGAGCGIAVLGGLLLFGSIALAPAFSGLLPLLGVAIGLVGLVWVFTSTAMPKKTDFGSEETAKWRAFSNYLQQIQKYTDVQAAADKFQQYLPYAVALGIERQLINQFNNVPAAMPPYYAPYGWYPHGYYPVGVGGPSQQQAGGANAGPTPSFDPGGAMQGMSDSLAGAMQGMADSFTTMVNSASSALTSSPSSSGSSSGGSWGGGGGSFGGGGGGGGSVGAD
ncbi:MAG: DUF2207 domain-containing protein [Chloroflexota bacterium]|nr:DUF2207 domain-containing protein [Chloroflexota bacterium]